MTGGEAVLIDESYNANPASMNAAIGLLGAAPVTEGGRRIAVLGEMLELGESAPSLHAGLADALLAAKVDVVYAAGELMRHLWEQLPAKMRGLYAGSAVGLVGAVEDAVGPGDVVMIKGSNASKVSAVARALESPETRRKRRINALSLIDALRRSVPAVQRVPLFVVPHRRRHHDRADHFFSAGPDAYSLDAPQAGARGSPFVTMVRKAILLRRPEPRPWAAF